MEDYVWHGFSYKDFEFTVSGRYTDQWEQRWVSWTYEMGHLCREIWVISRSNVLYDYSHVSVLYVIVVMFLCGM